MLRTVAATGLPRTSCRDVNGSEGALTGSRPAMVA
jgi:hypothetical protein